MAIPCVQKRQASLDLLMLKLARRLGCRRSLALVNNSTYEILTGSLGLDVAINPREITVSSVLQHVKRGSLGSVHTASKLFSRH